MFRTGLVFFNYYIDGEAVCLEGSPGAGHVSLIDDSLDHAALVVVDMHDGMLQGAVHAGRADGDPYGLLRLDLLVLIAEGDVDCL